MKKVAVILSGCGVYDGAEIFESVLTLLRLEQQGAIYQCLAPNIDQMHVVNHLNGETVEGQSRNVLQEAARICRGEILDLGNASPQDYDALILPGGFGVAKNLSDFATKGAACSVNPAVAAFVSSIHNAGKPVGLVCIAPALAPLLFGKGTQCTIGSDQATAEAIAAMGGQHQGCTVEDIIIDQQRKVLSTPAYMLADSITEAASGINKLVDALLDMA